MEKKIKTLYIFSIVAILAFLGMQGYWLYTRFEYSLTDYEDIAGRSIENALEEYNKARVNGSSTGGSPVRTRSAYNMDHKTDSTGKTIRKVSVTTKIIDGRKLIGIKENRKLTPQEKAMLGKIVLDSVNSVETKRATLDVTSAPSDGVAWNAMKNFELEVQSPFTIEGIDSVLTKENIDADISLIETDTLVWSHVLSRHSSALSPRFRFMAPYSELEKKAVVIECRIPTSEVLREMGWTLVLAIILSIFLILCLVWQIETIAKLTRLDKMRNSFITTMIHELKRPISTLKMCISGIENDRLMEDDSLRHELTGETRIALDNLSAYFSKLRDITFNNVEQIPLNITSFSLYSLVDNVIKSVTIPSGKEVAFENNVPEGMETSADRSHLMNILTNLIENAIKYSGSEVAIKINAENTANGVLLTVSDNGNGISSADTDKIFNRFYRGNAYASETPGMGLGLAYVKLLVEAHGGQISVDSEEGTGSTFTISLPQ